MPQIIISGTNIETFGFDAVFNPKTQKVLFDTSSLTEYNDASGTGQLYVLGIAFSVIDQEGVILASVDWDNPQIKPQDGETDWELDLSSIGIDFFFQTYKIIGYIKDGDGQVYQTNQVNPRICQPVGITSGGYVQGVFQVTPNCPDSVLTVKEVTPLVYNNTTPEEVSKEGALTYPAGTISAVSFTGTPFTNDVIYTGQYRVNNTTVARYSLGNDMYVDVSYVTNNVFEVTCANKLQDVLCCLVDLQKTKVENCNNAAGERAAQQLQAVEIPLFIAIAKEFAGQDASAQVEFIKKTLGCNCGSKSIIQNEFTPINPSVTNIVMQGVGGTSIATPTINGNTKTYNIQSNVYQVVKGDTGDLGFSIALNTATANTIKYVITLNYEQLAETILNTINADSTLLTLFNSLVSTTNFTIDLTNLNGGCIIDLSSTNYFLSLKVPSASTTITGIRINGVDNTTAPIAVNNVTAIEAWLNGLGLGTFDVSFSSGTSGSYINILTTGNSNTVTSATFSIGGSTTVLFQMTNKSIIAFLQAVVDYICGLSDLQVALSSDVTVCYVNYNGETITTVYPASTTKQSQLNTAFATALCNTASAINLNFFNGLTKAGFNVKLGGNLTEATTITFNGFVFKAQIDSNNYLTNGSNSWIFVNRSGTAPSDLINVDFKRNELFINEIATNADRTAIAYYGLAQTKNQYTAGDGSVSSIGTKVPNSLDSGTPQPPNDPERTAYVRTRYDIATDEGYVDIYGKTQTHTGSVSDFDTLLSVKAMTTVERDAIDVSLLTRNRIIFNTTVGKHQGWDGSSWNNFY